MIKLTNREKGFTLIEVVIVLAIAALIILVVLQAVNSAQKSNRDSTRKQEASRIVSLLEQYASNNNGAYPTNTTTLTDGAQDAVGTTTTGTMYAYDKTLDQKYNTLAGTYSATGPITGTCPAITAKSFTLIYAPSQTTGSPRAYELAVCLEAGGLSSIH